jgi:hypothetical protein
MCVAQLITDDIAPALDSDVKLTHRHHLWPWSAAAPVHCDLFLFHRPSHRTYYSPSPVHESPSSSEKGTETDPSSTTTITLTGLPYTVEVDIRPVFQRFVKV